MVNTGLKGAGANWAPKVGILVLFVTLLVAGIAIGKVACEEVWAMAFSENDAYTLTNLVLEVEGTGDDLKLTVFFHRAGKRKILARYAALEPL